MMKKDGYPPKEWDAIIFYIDPTGAECIETFQVTPIGAMNDGIPVEAPEQPSDKIQCRVGMVSTKNGIPRVEEPFVSNFYDPYVYAENMLKSGFTGLMVKTGGSFLDEFFNLSYTVIKVSALTRPTAPKEDGLVSGLSKELND